MNYGSDQPFTITPETGYHVETLTVDAAAVTPATSYTFKNVTAAHTISAAFAINTYTLTYTAGANGSILGTTPQTVDYGALGTAVTAVPATGYHFVSWSDGVMTADPQRRRSGEPERLGHLRDQHLHADLHRRRERHISGTTPQAVNHGSNGSAVTAVADPGYHFVSWSDGVATATRSETKRHR